MNDLPYGITSTCKIFADDTSLFSKVLDVNESTKKLNLVNGLFNGKCSLIFNPRNKLMKSYFLENQKSKVCSYPPLTCNNNDVKKCSHQKHLGIILDFNTDRF